MPKIVKSQWEFGELFPAQQPARTVFSVSDLTGRIKGLLEQQFRSVWVTGEITNFRLQSSGHAYFSIKDAGAQLSCVLFRGEQQVDRSLLEDGRKVILRGEVTVYEPRGAYQLRVTALEVQGLGVLQIAFEKLKQKLSAEGLFEAARKKPLPPFPARIGLVTSPTGAAIRDVLHVVRRRNPSLEIILAPCRVQGEGAAREIAAAIQMLNDLHAQAPAGWGLDLILVTRGGGSLEDLWAFNEEVVARAVAASTLPIVSGVGHEIDFTICDFVADFRAATPSAAAEIITEGVFSSCEFVAGACERMRLLVTRQLQARQRDLLQLARGLERYDPARRVQEHWQHLDELLTSLHRCARKNLRQHAQSFQALAVRLPRLRPRVLIEQRRQLILLATQRLVETAHHRLKEQRRRLELLTSRLALLGPEQVLARGYSITSDAETGRIVRDESQVSQGQRLLTRLARGTVRSRVE
jgi:exodeoxyribonuclease VII large subunit